MKKNLLVISLIFAMCCTAYAQEVQTENTNDNGTVKSENVEISTFCPHHINIHFGEAFTNNIYNRVKDLGFNQYYSLSSMLDVDYAYFFNEHWGLGLGVGVNRLGAKAAISKSGIIGDYDVANDDAFDAPVTYDPNYDLYYDARGLREKEVIWAVEVPLKAHFDWRFDGRNGIYAALGVQGYFPFKAFNKYTGEGHITTSGYEALYNQWYEVHPENGVNKMENHFGTYTYDGRGKDVKMRCSVDVLADFGGVFQISRIADFYIGAYAKYGFLDILPKNKTSFLQAGENGIPTFQGTLGSDILDIEKQNRLDNGVKVRNGFNKWNLLQVGLKAGFHIKACANPVEKSKKQLEKEILEELKNKSNEPIIIKQDPQYIYIVPVCDQLDAEDDPFTPEEKAAIQQLSDELAKTKILFDLDKDIPKIQEYNDNINKCVAILKDNPSLKVIVEGYTCDLGSEEHNRDLAQRRANKVRDIFIQKGVSRDQIETATYTANDPQNKQNIQDSRREEHRAAIFRIVKR